MVWTVEHSKGGMQIPSFLVPLLLYMQTNMTTLIELSLQASGRSLIGSSLMARRNPGSAAHLLAFPCSWDKREGGFC